MNPNERKPKTMAIPAELGVVQKTCSSLAAWYATISSHGEVPFAGLC